MVSEEQTGFIKGRLLFYNVLTLINIIYSKHSTIIPEVVISVDAEKAFDRVEWDFLLAVLHKFGLGDAFISWIRLLYTSQLVSPPMVFSQFILLYPVALDRVVPCLIYFLR